MSERARPESDEPSKKRQRRIGFTCNGEHPNQIQPFGNYYLELTKGSEKVKDLRQGLGSLNCIEDEILLPIFEMLEARDLASIMKCSKACYAFAIHEELWRQAVVRDFRGDFAFQGSWRCTYAAQASGKPVKPVEPISLRGMFSDLLYQPFYCATVELSNFFGIDNIERRSNLSLEEFIRDFEKPNKPVLITDAAKNWPALRKWSKEYLLEKYGDMTFRAEAVDIKLSNYYRYADQAHEEAPLYLFDSKFADKAPEMGTDYEVPVYFSEDLFSLLGADRPDHRWIIAGPVRSGSIFHKDPNSTNAWNTIVKGAKKWILLPPECPPPGVLPSDDGAQVTTSTALVEWFVNFYAETQRMHVKPIECICREGETVFVPHGWWHAVLNIEDCVAITQNYVSRRNLLKVLDFFKNKPEQISGFSDESRCHLKENLGEAFEKAFREKFPGELEALRKEEEELALQKMSKWEKMQMEASSSSFKFSFSFAGAPES